MIMIYLFGRMFSLVAKPNSTAEASIKIIDTKNF